MHALVYTHGVSKKADIIPHESRFRLGFLCFASFEKTIDADDQNEMTTPISRGVASTTFKR